MRTRTHKWQRLPALLAAFGLLVAAGCSEQAGPERDAGALADGKTADSKTADDQAVAVDSQVTPTADQGALSCLGTVYPAGDVIDPDNPVFSDASHTPDQVKEMFAAAKLQNNNAYLAYKAALINAEALTCAFCACGCETSDNHISAVDCFKDLHGFG